MLDGSAFQGILQLIVGMHDLASLFVELGALPGADAFQLVDGLVAQ